MPRILGLAQFAFLPVDFGSKEVGNQQQAAGKSKPVSNKMDPELHNLLDKHGVAAEVQNKLGEPAIGITGIGELAKAAAGEADFV